MRTVKNQYIFVLSLTCAYLFISNFQMVQAQYPNKSYEAVVDNYSSNLASRVWNDGKGHERSESLVSGMKTVSIIDFPNKVIYSINDQTKTISKMPMDSKSYTNEPDPNVRWTNLGQKIIDGHTCDGKRANVNGSVMEYWVGKDTGCTVLVTSNSKTIMRLRSWKAAVPSPSLFSLPSGYRQVDMSAYLKNIPAMSSQASSAYSNYSGASSFKPGANFDPEAMKKLYGQGSNFDPEAIKKMYAPQGQSASDGD